MNYLWYNTKVQMEGYSRARSLDEALVLKLLGESLGVTYTKNKI